MCRISATLVALACVAAAQTPVPAPPALDHLVTPTGARVLSGALPKDPDEIEKAMVG